MYPELILLPSSNNNVKHQCKMKCSNACTVAPANNISQNSVLF
uniref:Uncharacterized protein n=1 Tax=Anguilla anguilla TaxID=7936 RepID=A0A0E9RKS7_ANGAN